MLPPKSLGALVDILLEARPELGSRLTRFSERRPAQVSLLMPVARSNLALQKETLTAALQIARMETKEVLTWSSAAGEQRSFLEGLPKAHVREDAAIISDFADVPGFDAIRDFSFAARVFQNTDDPSVRLKVIMANRLELEKQTGADLIYYN
jgi:hypothetical protein